MYLDNRECWRGDEAVRSSIKGQLWPVYNTMAEVAEELSVESAALLGRACAAPGHGDDPVAVQ